MKSLNVFARHFSGHADRQQLQVDRVQRFHHERADLLVHQY